MRIGQILAGSVVAGLLVGCAIGRKFSIERAAQVRVGMTTNQLVELMGSRPFSITPVEADLAGNVQRPAYRFNYSSTGLESWTWFHDSGARKQVATFIVADGKVVQAASSIARSESEAEAQNREAVTNLESLVQTRREAETPAQTTTKEEKCKAFIAAHPELSAQIRASILASKVCLDMPAEALEICWGRPTHKSKSTPRLGTSETWHFGSGPDPRLVFLTNGKVTGWQASE